jgi:hypothetical protein
MAAAGPAESAVASHSTPSPRPEIPRARVVPGSICVPGSQLVPSDVREVAEPTELDPGRAGFVVSLLPLDSRRKYVDAAARPVAGKLNLPGFALPGRQRTIPFAASAPSRTAGVSGAACLAAGPGHLESPLGGSLPALPEREVQRGLSHAGLVSRTGTRCSPSIAGAILALVAADPPGSSTNDDRHAVRARATHYPFSARAAVTLMLPAGRAEASDHPAVPRAFPASASHLARKV